jgi:endonuclease/exonuclease/phosphatase (EEP) superfamily protein YafD
MLDRRRPLDGPRLPQPHDVSPGSHPGGTKIVSWNLLRLTGAILDDVVRLIEAERPDLLVMQEVTHDFDALCARVGGHYSRTPLPGRIHGLAMWMPRPMPHVPMVLPLPAGTLVHRVSQILDLGPFAVANVHLSHGQLLNRRQLRRIARALPGPAAVLGDYNLLGPVLLPGFRDVGPRAPTHVMADIVPLRLDRCVVRGLTCTERTVLPRERSDHCPIVVRLAVAGAHAAA